MCWPPGAVRDAVPPPVLLRASIPEYLAILVFPPRFERRGFGGSPGRGAACPSPAGEADRSGGVPTGVGAIDYHGELTEDLYG